MTNNHFFGKILLVLFFLAFSHSKILVAETPNITINIPTPTPGFGLSPISVHSLNNKHWVLLKVEHPEQRVRIQVISQASTSIKIDGPLKDHRVFILNYTWSWGKNKEYTYLKSSEDFKTLVMKESKVQFVKLETPKSHRN